MLQIIKGTFNLLHTFFRMHMDVEFRSCYYYEADSAKLLSHSQNACSPVSPKNIKKNNPIES